ncbi:MAG: DUF87 domain-containing protein [Nitratireductor sp.]
MAGFIHIGDAYRRPSYVAFRMPTADRLLHFYILGQTGTGKSTLLRNLARQDAENGVGVCVLDPHGDLAEELRSDIGPRAIYWDIADPDCGLGYNPLTRVAASYRPLVASALIDTFKKQWIDAWGPRMEHLLRYALLALLDQPRADLRDVLPLFVDKNCRAAAVANLESEQVRQFWQVEWKALRYDRALDGVSPIANKLGAFLAHPLVRRAVSEPRQPLRFRRIMDEGQVLIVNLSTGRLGADTANVMGGLILSGIAHAALSRADQPPAMRRPFFAYIDEAPSFTTSALTSMLPQLRKYKVGLTLAHQYLTQFEPALQAAVLGNVGNIIVFRVGAQDARFLGEQLGGIEPRDLLGLANYECFARIIVAGAQTKAFSMKTSNAKVAEFAAGGGRTRPPADGRMAG